VAEKLALQFSAGGPSSRSYPRIVDFTPKGQMRSVQWHVDGQAGATTTIQKNFDQPAIEGMPPYEEKLKRRRESVALDRIDSRTRKAGESVGDVLARGGRF